MEILFLLIGLIIGLIFSKLLYKKKYNPAIENELREQNKKIEDQNASLNQEIVKLNQTITSNTAIENELREQNKKIESQNASLTQEIIKLNQTITSSQTELKFKDESLTEQKQELERTREKLKVEFENLAQKILDQKSEKFGKENQTQISNMLKPLQENIGKFEKTIKDNYDSENRERSSLKTEIEHLLNLNHQLSNDAINLTNALKHNPKAQGNWGELQLEVILEKSGLEKGVNFHMQTPKEEFENNKRKIPDFIIDLPENKNLVIDAKVSLTAYENYCNHTSDDQKKVQLKRHIDSIKNHINDLFRKYYQDLPINTPDYVLMFIPIEPALTLALQNDTELFNRALDKNIILISTTTLMATMRTVSFVWRQENQKENVLEMARQCGALYDKFVGLTEDLMKVGYQMDTAKNSYSQAMNKLSGGRGNLIRKVENIKTLGAKTSKSIDEKLLRLSEKK